MSDGIRSLNAKQNMGNSRGAEHCDVLISYRRKGGAEVARYVADYLRGRGYSVFLDVDALGSGNWSKELEQRISECRDFIPVISEGFFDRCIAEEGDVVRRELAIALEHRKNVVPLLVADQPFPAGLPQDISGVAFCNGVRYVHDFGPGSLAKLARLLTSHAGGVERLDSGEAYPRVIVAILAMYYGGYAGASSGESLLFMGPFGDMTQFTTTAILTFLKEMVPVILLLTFLSYSRKIPGERLFVGAWIPFWAIFLPLLMVVCSVIVVFCFHLINLESYFAGGVLGQLAGLGLTVALIKYRAWAPLAMAFRALLR